MMAGPYCAAILAAGRSTRMQGTDKRFALVDGKPLLARVIASAQASSADSVIVITRAMSPDQRESLMLGRAELVLDDTCSAAMSLSLLRALDEAQAHGASHLIVLLGDMPKIGTTDIDRMIAVSRTAPGQIIRATDAGAGGNPVIFPVELIAENRHLITGDAGAKPVLDVYRAEIRDVEIGTGAMTDIDTLEDLRGIGTAR